MINPRKCFSQEVHVFRLSLSPASCPENGLCISRMVSIDTIDKDGPLVELVLGCTEQRISANALDSLYG